MSLKIMSKEMLDTNAYDKLIVLEENGNFFVKVSGRYICKKYQHTSYMLSERLKHENDIDKVMLVVESFLENTQIDCIETSVLHYGYNGIFVKISGTRELYFQVTNNDLFKKVIKMACYKYERDRYDFCINNNEYNLYNFVLSNRCSSNKVKVISCDNCIGCEEVNYKCPNYVEFKVLFNDNIISFDKNFLDRFVYDKLWEIGLEAQVIESRKDIRVSNDALVSQIVDGYSIVCGNLIIKFDCNVSSSKYVFDICNNIVNRYNKELRDLENVKKRQLKMEGF